MVEWPCNADDGDVTDNSGTVARGVAHPRAWQAVLAAGLTVTTAASVALVVGVTDPASADTVVTAVTRAVVSLPDGTEHAARIGETLPRGSVVRTGPEGGARLSAAGRDVYVGALSTVGVLDGIRESLDRGQVMVDSRDGARLDVTVSGDTVRTPSGGLTRIERGQVLRVGAFQQTATVMVAGRQATTPVRALYQVVSQYGTLPGQPTALTLRGDGWEQRLAADLTAADRDLTGLAQGLRGSEGTVVLGAARQDLVTSQVDPTAQADQGERALSVALAEAGRAAAPVENLATVRDARSEGGSWGVVAAIIRASVTDVSGRLNRSLPPTVPVVAAPVPGTAGFPGVPGLPGLPGSPGQPSAAPSSSAGPTRGPRPTTGPTTSPTPSPSASPGLVQQVVTLLNDVLPDPIPTLGVPPLLAPRQAPAPTPSPTRAPLLQVGPLRVG